ncbi:MAG: aminotransferase class I/II-fold pyridoxal phosphate-dependent enzyme [Ignavibacteria bacterium]|nr:aminotransferase class I/II-fold pyridoxal phosphate-dependent enzyme [Ignavibacteria bacterium]
MKYTDLRSDTVTKPSKGMLAAMMKAKLGDDVFSEDPTIIALQEKCAKLTGKEKALFVPTGVMGNQLAIKAHTISGDEVIVESESHILNYETGGPSVISNVQLLPLKGENGILDVETIRMHVRSNEYYFPKTRLICLENTHNRAGGVILPYKTIKAISTYAREYGIKMHLDGARIFNAIAETGISLKDYAYHFDTVNFCFSKGLGCPIGSVICGDAETIEIAHKWRKILGGGMRQAGILGAAAIYALDHNVKRLKDDNKRAKQFAKTLAGTGSFNLNAENVHTNIVIFSSVKDSKEEFMKLAKKKGVLLSSGSYENIRAVFHMDLKETDITKAIKILKSI